MELVIIVPSLDFTGPVKGAFAICNLMNEHMKVTLISLKGNKKLKNIIAEEVKVIDLYKKNFIRKISFIKNYCDNREDIRVLSICLPADVVNIFINPKIKRYSSVRGNLFSNYNEYAFGGNLLALFHYIIQKFFDKTIVMNKKMYRQVFKYSKKEPVLIHNFIDEGKLEKFYKPKINKSKKFSFVFIGRLIERKGIISLINAFIKVSEVKDANLHILGDGPLRNNLKKFVFQKGIDSNVFFHGFLDSPYEILSNADVFVLPSFSEGTPRSCLEALYLGIPSILRNVDGNDEIQNGNNITLFDNEDQLPEVMLKKASQSRIRKKRRNLLPYKFSREYNLSLYLKLFKT